MRASIIGFIMVLIPYVQNAADGPSSWAWINVFMGYYTANNFSSAYIFIITLWMIRWMVLTLFVISLLKDLGESEPTKFDLNK
jgi:hypothetical protein